MSVGLLRFAISTIAILLTTLIPINHQARAVEWTIEVVDPDAHSGGGLSLDSAGGVHICYKKYNILHMASKNGSGWQFESSGLITYGPPALAIDENGDPHVAHGSSGPGNHVFYAHKGETGWENEVVGGGGLHYFSISSLSIVLNQTGVPIVGYGFQSGFDFPPFWNWYLACKNREGGTWQGHYIESGEGNRSIRHSLCLDSEGVPNITYNRDGLRFAREVDEAWPIELIDDDVGCGYSSLVIRDNERYVCYKAGDMLVYANWNGSMWHFEPVDESGSVPKYVNLCLDVNDFPHVVYYGESSEDLFYAFKDGSGWSVEPVDSVGSVGQHAGFVLDNLGYLHVSYFDATAGALKYARAKAPPTVLLSGTLNMGSLQLSWSSVPETYSYWIYGAPNSPHFAPGSGPAYTYRIAVLPDGTATWSSSDGISDPANNWTYLVMAVDESDQEITRSNRVGEWDWEMGIP